MFHDTSRPFPDYFAGCLVLADAEKPAVPQFSVDGPLDECDLDDELRTNPVRPDTRQAGRFREWTGGDFDGVHARAQIQQLLRIESGSHLTREYEVVAFKVAEQ
jgi:hypothetical protein